MLPIGAYSPDSFRHVHMGPDEAIKVFKEINAKTFIPMHYGTNPLNRGTPEQYMQALGQTNTKVVPLQPGEKFSF